jgi:predicted NBD/HSP70 family sugar kinase
VTLPAKATHRRTRAHNEALVLRAVYDYAPLSRADIARLTGLTRTTVSEVVAGLLDDGLVREIGRGRSSGGKAPILLEVAEDARHVVGLDLGEQSFVGALVNLRGTIRISRSIEVAHLDGKEALAAVYQLVDELVAASPRQPLGIGVGTPGLVESTTGTIRWAVNLDWQDLALGSLLRDRYGLPVRVVNDSQAAAYAEYLFAAGPRVPNLIAIKVGRGIGAGIVLGGELYQGDAFGAGEIGHVRLVDDGEPCRCGRNGCLETVASSRAVLGRAARLAAERPDSPLHRAAAGRSLSLEDLVTALERGDSIARAVVAEAGRALGRGVVAVVSVLNVRRIVLLGALAILGEPWLEACRAEVARSALGPLVAETEIVLGRSSSDVVVLGSSALVLSREVGLSLLGLGAAG